MKKVISVICIIAILSVTLVTFVACGESQGNEVGTVIFQGYRDQVIIYEDDVVTIFPFNGGYYVCIEDEDGNKQTYRHADIDNSAPKYAVGDTFVLTDEWEPYKYQIVRTREAK